MSMLEGQQMMGEGSQSAGDGQRDTYATLTTDCGKQISICPMCQGKGYYEEIGQPEICNTKNIDTNKESKIGGLPNIAQPQLSPPSYQLEQLFKANDTKVISSRMSDSAVPITVLKANTRFPPVHIPNSSGRITSSTTGQVRSSPNNAKVGNFPHLVNLLPTPAKLEKSPEDAARLAAIKLNRDDWETKKAGLEECLQLSHFNPEELEQYMSLVYRAMSSLLNNFRPQVTLFTCQAASEFFAHMRSTCRPEYDELVFALLSRTADTNRYIRLYANDALDKMVTYIPTVHAVRPLVDKGPIHNNPLVRTATARLLTCIVALKTPNAILTHPNLRDTCRKMLETATLLLADNNLDTRGAAKKLMQRFMNEEEFESIYYAEVDEKLRKRVARVFADLKYKIKTQG
uniref:TOG domain-containing protein n=1 Tax=Homalodisca liturata TaxID=320908 RepID=A0A1B6JBB9_9HEMI